MTTGIAASSNPFELHENFQAIQKDQSDLLKELKSVSAKFEVTRKVKDGAELDAKEDQKGTLKTTPSDSEQAVVVEELDAPKAMQPNTVVTNEAEDGLPKSTSKEAMQEGMVKSSKEEQPKEIVPIEKVKADQAKIEAQKAAEMKAKAEAEAKQKAAEEKACKEKEREANLEAEREAAKKKVEAERQAAAMKKAKEAEAQKTQQSAEKIESTVKETKAASSVDINITREEMEAAKRAQKELQEAIREVDQED